MGRPPRSPFESPEDEALLWHLHRNDADAQWREALARFRPQELVGLTVSEARSRVESAGGVFEAGPPDTPMTADLKLDRVRATAIGDVVVVAEVG